MELPNELISKINDYLELKNKHMFCLTNKDIFNECIESTYDEKIQLNKLKCHFKLFKEKLMIKQIITFIQTSVIDQLLVDTNNNINNGYL
tara:strand:+ start:10489 stop:10758 length:270 start_codon:yes stop_codon:yes gene_type:complete